MLLGVRHALVGETLVRGDVRVRDGRVAAVGVVPPGRAGLAAPGFVDLQVNGFAGVDFLAAQAADYARCGPALAATGVTAYLPTFVTAPEAEHARALAAVGEAATEVPANGGRRDLRVLSALYGKAGAGESPVTLAHAVLARALEARVDLGAARQPGN